MKDPVIEIERDVKEAFQEGKELPHGFEYTTYQPAEGMVMQMFSTPFLRGKLELDVEEVAMSSRHILSQVEQGDVNTEYTTYFDEDARVSMHGQEWFQQFSDQIKDSYVAFISNVFQIPVSHLSRDDIHLFAWLNRYTGPHQHATHNHVNSHISGTYYIKTEKSNQPIKFLNPNMGAIANHLAVDRPMEREGYPHILFSGVNGCDSSFEYFPQEGEFLFWPSYIQHAVEPSQEEIEDYERITLSFNLKHRQIIDNNETGRDMPYEFLEENIDHGR